jgi:hypothetical protein
MLYSDLIYLNFSYQISVFCPQKTNILPALCGLGGNISPKKMTGAQQKISRGARGNLPPPPAPLSAALATDPNFVPKASALVALFRSLAMQSSAKIQLTSKRCWAYFHTLSEKAFFVAIYDKFVLVYKDVLNCFSCGFWIIPGLSQGF